MINNNFNFNFRILQNKTLSRKDLFKIVYFKNSIWKYGIKSQLKWIKLNMSKDDVHILFEKNNKIIAYANLFYSISNNDNFIGIGNVSVHKEFRKLGIGSLIINLIISYLNFNKLNAILFCKKGLVNFYLKNGFKLLNNFDLLIDFDLKQKVYILANFTPDTKIQLLKNF